MSTPGPERVPSNVKVGKTRGSGATTQPVYSGVIGRPYSATWSTRWAAPETSARG